MVDKIVQKYIKKEQIPSIDDNEAMKEASPLITTYYNPNVSNISPEILKGPDGLTAKIANALKKTGPPTDTPPYRPNAAPSTCKKSKSDPEYGELYEEIGRTGATSSLYTIPSGYQDVKTN